MESMSVSELSKVNKVSDDFLLGQRGRFLDDNLGSSLAVKPSLSQHPIEAILVKNTSGGTLAAGTIVTWATDSTYGNPKAVAGTAGATSYAAGVVNPYIASAVPANGFFWMIVEGPCKFLFTTGTTLAVSDALAVAASGRVAKATIGTTNGIYIIGMASEGVDTAIASDTLFRGFAHFPAG